MRFLIFNIVVGVALVYLYKGDGPAFSSIQATPIADLQITAANETPGANPGAGHARDTLKEPVPERPATQPPNPHPEKPKAAEPVPLPAAPPVVDKQPKSQALPALKEPITVAQHIARKPVFTKVQPTESAALRRRRAEVLQLSSDDNPITKFELTQGTELMSRQERRRALETLAEEMELLFLEKVGG